MPPLGTAPRYLVFQASAWSSIAKAAFFADRVGVEPTRDWLLRTAFETMATTYWLAYPYSIKEMADRGGVEPPRR